jgi:tRNA(fMet)-specific endonuclease VapC
MRWLLDTNTIIHALNGVLSVRRRLNEVEDRDEILTSALVVGELIYGAECSARCEENRENIRRKLERVRIVPFDGRIADGWGTLKARLRARGRLKADIDLLIRGVQKKIVAEILPRIRADMELGNGATREQSGQECCP